MTESTPKKKKSLLGRILKWSGITLLLLIITAVILPFLFKDKIIEMAKAEINNNVNATVTFGEFDLSLISSFPDFRFSIKDLKIVGKGKFDGDTLASIPALKLDLDLMSVIKGDQYTINSVIMDSPRIFAVVLPDGSASYDIAKPSTDTAAAPAGEATKFNMTLKHLEINHAYIVYDDATLAMKTILDDFTHTLSGDFTQDLFDMETMTTIERFTCDYDGMTYLSKVKTTAKADLAMDMINWKFTFKDNEFSLNELAFGLDGFFAMPGADYDMDLKFAAKQSEFKSFLSLIPGAYVSAEDFANVKTAGTLAFDGYLKGKYSEAQKTSPGFGLNLQVKDGMFQYPSVPKSVSAINIDCKIDDASGVPDQTKIDVNTFHMDFGGNPIDAALHVSTPVSDANLDGWVKGKLDLASVTDIMPLEKGDQLTGIVDADVKMKGRMSQIEQEKYDEFQCSGKLDVTNMLYKGATDTYETKISAMNMTFSPQFVELAKFDAMLGRNDVHANGRMDNVMAWLFKDSLLSGKFNLTSALMDLNQFATEEDAGAAPTAADSAPMTIIEVPSNLDFVINSAITKLIYDDITMDAVSGTATIRNSMVDLSNLKMNLMGGSMIVNGYYSTQNVMVPKVNFDMNISNFDVQQTFKTFNTVAAIAPVAQYTTGKFSTTMKYTSDLGADMMPLVETMNGQGTLSTSSVVVDGFPAMKKLDEALKMNKFSKVTLQDIKMLSFKIENGNITTEPFDFTAGKATGKMGGSTRVDQTINYVMDISIPRTEFGPANAALNGLVSGVQAKGIPFQLGEMVNVSALFTGTVTDPKVSVNLKEAGGNLMDNIKDQVTDVVNHAVDSAKTVITDKSCEEAQKQLDAAKITAANVKTAAYKAADDAKTLAYTEADKIEKSYKNPLEKAAKKAAADAARKAADQKNKDAKTAADNAEKNSIASAQQKKDATCK